jgi:hypothetical protein
MTSPLVPTATITLDKERTLRMDLNALSDFESMTGKSFMSGGLDFENLALADIRALLWACLVQDDESLTLRDVGAMLHVGNLEPVTSAITKLVTDAMPEPEEGSEPAPLPETSPSSAGSNGGPDTAPRRPRTSA